MITIWCFQYVSESYVQKLETNPDEAIKLVGNLQDINVSFGEK